MKAAFVPIMNAAVTAKIIPIESSLLLDPITILYPNNSSPTSSSALASFWAKIIPL
ncbi:hypothetical protein D3C78_1690590 [compost metagenome]